MSKHLGGSKSFVEHAIDLDAMQKIVETTSQTLSDGSEPFPPNMDTIYLKASSGENKRRLYGLGSLASRLYPESFCGDAPSTSPPPLAAIIPL